MSSGPMSHCHTREYASDLEAWSTPRLPILLLHLCSRDYLVEAWCRTTEVWNLKRFAVIYTLLTFKMDSKTLWVGREWQEAEKARDGITFVGERGKVRGPTG